MSYSTVAASLVAASGGILFGYDMGETGSVIYSITFVLSP